MRDITIRIRIKDSVVGSRLETPGKAVDGVYDIIISPKQIEELKTAPAIVLAHEIGHAIGYEFNYPMHKQTEMVAMQSYGQQMFAVSRGILVQQENEAWDIAEEAVKRIREFCINDYKQQAKLLKETIR